MNKRTRVVVMASKIMYASCGKNITSNKARSAARRMGRDTMVEYCLERLWRSSAKKFMITGIQYGERANAIHARLEPGSSSQPQTRNAMTPGGTRLRRRLSNSFQ